VPQNPTTNGKLLESHELKVFSLPVRVSTFVRMVRYGGGRVMVVGWDVEVATVRWRSAVPATAWHVRIIQWTFDPASRCAIVLCAKRCLPIVSRFRRTIAERLSIAWLFAETLGIRRAESTRYKVGHLLAYPCHSSTLRLYVAPRLADQIFTLQLPLGVSRIMFSSLRATWGSFPHLYWSGGAIFFVQNVSTCLL